MIPNEFPLEWYNAYGTTVRFDFGWVMIADSAIGVLVNNEEVEDTWYVEGNSVVFYEAPIGFVTVYRRTKPWMPEDYVAFGRFIGDKTELSVDHIIMICQEYWGDAQFGEVPCGIVGNPDLHIRRGEFDVTVISEKGTDAVVPMWDPDDAVAPPPSPPDPSILWGGDRLRSSVWKYGSAVNCFLFFKMLDENIAYPVSNEVTQEPWVDLTGPVPDDEYWMRFQLSPTGFDLPLMSNGTAFVEIGQAFKMSDADGFGPYVQNSTYGLTPPVTVVSAVIIEICKDAGGLPDGNWASREVTLEAFENV